MTKDKSAIKEILKGAKRFGDWVLGDDTLDHTGKKVKDLYNFTGKGLKSVGSGTLDGTVRRFNEAIPYIEKAGFYVKEVEIGLGVTPNIVPHLVPTHVLDQEERKSLLKEVKGKTLITTVLTTLFKSGDMGRRIKFDGFDFICLEIEVGIIPSITLRYRRNDDARGGNERDLITSSGNGEDGL